MTRPKPYKLKCEKCGYSTLVRPKSDVLDIGDIAKQICPKCEINMKTVRMNMLDKVFG